MSIDKERLNKGLWFVGGQRTADKKLKQVLEPEQLDDVKDTKFVIEKGGKYMNGVGFDIGTGNIVSARKAEDGKIITICERDAFIFLGKWDEVQNKLSRSSVSYTKIDDKAYVIGNAAYKHANVFGNVELRRPMAFGMLNPTEKEALPIIKEIFSSVLGPPQCEKEVCCFVTPSEPIDIESYVIYHEDVVKAIVESLGYTAVNIKEGVALAYAGLVDEELTGLSLSFGAGMLNVCVMYEGLDCLNFSITKTGDWIDTNASRDVDIPIAHITAIKEDPEFDLLKTGGSREVKAIISYYRFVIRNVLTQIAHLFNTSTGMPYFKNPVKIVCGGGTASAKGFVEIFQQEYDKLDFPINIKAIEVIDEPLYAVAKGALSEALLTAERK